MTCTKSDSCPYYLQLQEMEEKVYNLRIGRRVLLNMVERVQKEKNNTFKALEEENQRLKQENIRMANKLMNRERHMSRAPK